MGEAHAQPKPHTTSLGVLRFHRSVHALPQPHPPPVSEWTRVGSRKRLAECPPARTHTDPQQNAWIETIRVLMPCRMEAAPKPRQTHRYCLPGGGTCKWGQEFWWTKRNEIEAAAGLPASDYCAKKFDYRPIELPSNDASLFLRVQHGCKELPSGCAKF